MDKIVKEEIDWFEKISSKTKNTFIRSNNTSYDFNYNVYSFPFLDRRLATDLFMIDVFEPKNLDREVIFPKDMFSNCIYEKENGCKIIYCDKEKSLEFFTDVSIKVKRDSIDKKIIVDGNIGNKIPINVKRKELKNINFYIIDEFKRGFCSNRLFLKILAKDKININFSKNNDDNQWPLYIGGEIIVRDYDYSMIGVFFIKRKE